MGNRLLSQHNTYTAILSRLPTFINSKCMIVIAYDFVHVTNSGTILPYNLPMPDESRQSSGRATVSAQDDIITKEGYGEALGLQYSRTGYVVAWKEGDGCELVFWSSGFIYSFPAFIPIRQGNIHPPSLICFPSHLTSPVLLNVIEHGVCRIRKHLYKKGSVSWDWTN